MGQNRPIRTPTRVSPVGGAGWGAGVGSLGHPCSRRGWGKQQEGPAVSRAPGQPRQQASLLEWNPYNPKIERELGNVGKGEQVKSWRLDHLQFLNHKSGDSEEHRGTLSCKQGPTRDCVEVSSHLSQCHGKSCRLVQGV